MNTEQFRQSLRLKWLNYYKDNRDWLVRLGVWVSYEGQRRPSSSFILATLSVLEPRLTQVMPIVVDLNSNPDRVVQALGLNFSPDEELQRAIAQNQLVTPMDPQTEIKMLPPGKAQDAIPTPLQSSSYGPSQDAIDVYLDEGHHGRSPHEVAAARDSTCYGIGGRNPAPSRSAEQFRT